jgi:hypothetical protein
MSIVAATVTPGLLHVGSRVCLQLSSGSHPTQGHGEAGSKSCLQRTIAGTETEKTGLKHHPAVARPWGEDTPSEPKSSEEDEVEGKEEEEQNNKEEEEGEVTPPPPPFSTARGTSLT